MGWRKVFLGEKMPDKDDPKYRQRYESDVNAGRKFARMMKLDLFAGAVQGFANSHRKLFLGLVFGLITLCFSVSIYRLATLAGRRQSVLSATERQEMMLRRRTDKVRHATGNQRQLPAASREYDNNNVNIQNDGRTEEN